MADELKLNHLTEQGNAHMVDVSEKAETKRIAIAEGFITMQAGTLATVLSHRAKKRRRYRDCAHRWHHGSEEDERAHPALPSGHAH